jgi:hypothetical protein
MLCIPFQVSETHFSLFITLDDASLSRMKQYDPAEVTFAKVMEGSTMKGLILKDIIIGYATAKDIAHILDLAKTDQPLREGLKYLSRGYAFRPDQGDGGEIQHVGPDHEPSA